MLGKWFNLWALFSMSKIIEYWNTVAPIHLHIMAAYYNSKIEYRLQWLKYLLYLFTEKIC